MAINPFKDSNLNDLQESVRQSFVDHFGKIYQKIDDLWERFKKKGNERITVMFIPHSEKKIINFHISIFTISAVTGIVVTVVTITSILIINHSSTVKEISIHEKTKAESEIQIAIYKEEINKLFKIFQDFKPHITFLYSLIDDNNIESDSLWGEGGETNQKPHPDNAEYNLKPSDELLLMQKMKLDLDITKQILGKIKSYLNYKQKQIENTPSIWPVDGFVVSRHGYRSSPYSFETELHEGIDIEAFPGAEIRATAPGDVKDVVWDPELGLTVSIRHKFGFTTSYSHCQRVSVEPGQKVSKGEVIAYVGRTGKTTEYICFYQIKIGTTFIDPMPYLNRISH